MTNSPMVHADYTWLSGLGELFAEYLNYPEWIEGPTSSVTGGGAIMAAEDEFARQTGTEFAVLLPSGTYAMRAALQAVGVRSGDEVIIPNVDWTANQAAVTSVGAVPVAVDVSPDTLTIDPFAVAAGISDRTKAVIATHTHGVPADVPAIQAASGPVPVIEDFTGAFGALMDGRPVGGLGTVGVMSLGPGKELDCGEGAVLVTHNESVWKTIVTESTHAVRRAASGIDDWPVEGFSIRVHPLTAVLALTKLRSWNASQRRESASRSTAVARAAGLTVLGCDDRRTLATPWVLVTTDSPHLYGDLLVRVPGAHVISTRETATTSLLASVQLVKPLSTDGG